MMPLVWLFLMAVFVTVSETTCRGDRQTSGKPTHIVFVLADDLGWNDVGYHGSKIKTPNIDRLAAGGVKLENYYTQPLCTPSRAALLTGKYPIHTGMQHFALAVDEPWGLPLNLQTLPENLRTLGYQSHLVGKWHLGFCRCKYTPLFRGFDSFFGYYPALEDHFNHTRLGINVLYNNNVPDVFHLGNYSTNLYTQKSINIIKNHNASKPLFLYLSYSAVHTPLQAPPKIQAKYSFIADPKRRTYAAMMETLDEGIGNLEKSLISKGIWNNTLFIFSADNGGMPGFGGASNFPLRGIKTTLWEGGVKGVAFVHGSMLNRKGTISKELIHITDWYPTLIHVAGGRVSNLIDGINVWNTLKDGTASPRSEILLNIDMPRSTQEEQETSYALGTYSGAALRRGHMKLMMKTPRSSWYGRPEDGAAVPSFQKMLNDRLPFVGLALYNITADPEERHDLKDRYPALVKYLKSRIEFYNRTTTRFLNQPPDAAARALAHKTGSWKPWIEKCRGGASSKPKAQLILVWIAGIGYLNAQITH